MTTTTVIGDVIKRISGSVNQPPPSPPGKGNPGGGKPGGGGGIGASAFETAIGTEEPIVWYTFRDNHFKQRVRDRAGSRHLAKQIAEATRSTVPTRTTHPGGALFDGITSANWATQGQFYKGPTGVLNGASAYTMLVSIRFLSRKASGQTIFGLGTEGTLVSGNNYLLTLFDSAAVGVFTAVRHRTGGGEDNLTPLITERAEDGVNRLFTVRSTGSSSQILKISKPGAKYVTEDTASQAALAAVNRALLLNAQDNTVQDSPSFVIDQIALWDSDIGATAEENLHDLWTAELGGYYPSMMEFDGSTGYYNLTADIDLSSGVTIVARFRWDGGTITSAGGFNRMIVNLPGTSGVKTTLAITNDQSGDNRAGRLNLLSQNGAASNICNVTTDTVVSDGEMYSVLAAYNPATGAAVIKVNSNTDDINPSAVNHTISTGTIATGSAVNAVGAGTGGVRFIDGLIGPFGLIGGYITDWSLFFNADGSPKPIDEVNWTEFGGQPEFWSHTAQMDNNKGSAGDMTLNGSVVMTEGGSP